MHSEANSGESWSAGRSGSTLAAVAAALLGALGSALLSAPAWAFHWPWRHAAAAPSAAQPVRVVAVALDAMPGAPALAAAVPVMQYWDRNTLLLDLTRLSGQGGATLTPIAAAGGWPVRMEFRVRPGSLARLEVQAAQRVVFFVPSQGAPLILKLGAGAYAADTARIRVQWSAAGDLAH